MKIYLLSQNDNTGYDTYDSCVVCAVDEDDAKSISPDGSVKPFTKGDFWSTWANSIESINCEEIGIAHDSQVRGVICASFNAG